jgi:hypothetical protein
MGRFLIGYLIFAMLLIFVVSLIGSQAQIPMSSGITIATTGTFTAITYNIEGAMRRIS